MLSLTAALAICLLWYGGVDGQIDLIHCRNALGMQDKRIADQQVTASSSHADSLGPKYARLRRKEGDGAWCPLGVAGPNSSEHWLQIQLNQLSYISVIGTQGRHGNGQVLEYTPRYKLNYSRDGVNWLQWKNYRGQSVLDGNTDSQNTVRRRLSPGIPSAEFIRFIPTAKSSRSVCVRLEIYGCKMPTTLLQYDIPTPDGGALGQNWNFDDETYDGRKESKTYHGGLGQLTDGVRGSEDIRETMSQVSTRTIGFDYVGWRNHVNSSRDVNMTFFFSDVRNFTDIRIHCLASKDIGASIFSSVEVTFSLDGRTFADMPHAPKANFAVESEPGVRLVVLPLKNAIARYVRARFWVRDEWMLISEVEFTDATVDIDIDPRRMFPTPKPVPVLIPIQVKDTIVTSTIQGSSHRSFDAPMKNWRTVYKRHRDVPTEQTPVFKNQERAHKRDRDIPSDEIPPTDATVTSKEFGNVAVIACSLAGVVVLLISIVVLLAWRQRRMTKTMTPPRYTYSVQAGSTPNVTLCLTDQRATFSTTASELPPKTGAPLPDVTARRAIATPHEYSDPKDALSRLNSRQDLGYNPPDVTLCGAGARNGVVPIPHYAETSICSLPPPYATPPPSTSGTHNSTWASSSPRSNGLPKYSSPSESSTLLAEESADDTGFCSELLDHCEECGVIEFPRQRLRFVEKLGEGQFGEVQLCQADPILRVYVQQNGISLSGESGDPVLVAVKLLRGDASPSTRDDFLKEAKIMSRMRDPNIVQLLAVCVEEEPYALVTEYMANGDLHGYLRRFRFGDTFNDVRESNSLLGNCDEVDCDAAGAATIRKMISRKPSKISRIPIAKFNVTLGAGKMTAQMRSCPVLMGITAQIAAGMRYLASLNFVHRDLATRNCLVGAGLNIRISDFGLSRSLYQSDYYKFEGKAVLPIRWMSWESIIMGKFSTASDVWAFGVTVWEVFSLCRMQPFQDLSDPEVIDNLNHICNNKGEEVYLQKPIDCPDKTYQVLKRCWRRDSDARPKFDQLYAFFKKQI